MAQLNYPYLIVGAGNAAGYAARRFVDNGLPKSDLCILGAEPVLPYERPALSKAFLTNANVRLPGFNTCVGGGGQRQTTEWYSEQGITTVLGQKVTSFNAESKSVTLEDGRVFTASKAIILATGADPIRLTRTPGHDLTGVHYLRDNTDALALYDALQACKGKTVAVIGGGYIGMEVTAAAVTVGCNVKMIFPETHIMPRLFTPEIAEPYENLYQDKGVQLLHNGRLCKAFLGDDNGHVRGVMMCRQGESDLEVDASLVVVGVGARATTSLFDGQVKLDERGGVVVDSSLQTSVPGIYAIGDIASFPLKLYDNRPARMEHVQNARDTATHVVDVIMNKTEAAYDYLPYFYSRVFQLSWQFFGDNVGECSVVSELDRAVLRDWNGEGDHPQLIAIWTDEAGVLAGIFMESPTKEDTANMKTIAVSRPTVDVAAFKACTTVRDAWKLLV